MTAEALIGPLLPSACYLPPLLFRPCFPAAVDPPVLGGIFAVEDEALSRETAVLGCGLSAFLNDNIEVFISYDATLNRDLTAHLFSAGLEYRW